MVDKTTSLCQRSELTGQPRIIKLDISQPVVVEHLEFLLVGFGDILEVLGIVGVGFLGVGVALLVPHVKPLFDPQHSTCISHTVPPPPPPPITNQPGPYSQPA